MSAAAEVAILRGGGYSDEEIAAHIAPDVAKLRGAGFSEADIGVHFGITTTPPFDPEPIRDIFSTAINEAVSEETKDFTFMQALEAGFQQSIVGLASRQKVPEILVGENASAADRITSQVAAVALDLPFFAIGAGIAAPAGGGLGSAATATGGAFALPAALREVLIQTYENGQIQTFDQFWDVLSGAAIAEFKGFVTGAAVGAVGPTAAAGVTAKLGSRGITPIAATGAARASEVATMVSVGSALEGEMPNAADFVDAGAVILVLTGAKKGAKSLRSTFKSTGKTPKQVLEDTVIDPTIREDLASKNHDKHPRAYKLVEPASKEKVASEIAKKTGKEVAEAVKGKAAEEAPPKEAPKEAKKAGTALDEVKKSISFKEPKERRTVRETLDSLYADWFREQHPLAKAVAEMTRGADVPIVENAAKLAQLEPGVTARAGHFLEFSPIEFKTFKRVGRPLKSILEPVKNDMEDFAAYLVAKRTLELKGKKDGADVSRTGVDLKVAKQAVKEGNARFEKVSEEVVEFQGHVLAYLRDAGVLTRESYDLMRAAGKDYVPLNRSFAEDAPIAKEGLGKKARDPIFRFRGSDRPIVNPFESILKNTYLLISIAERNQIGLQLTKMAEASGLPDIAHKVEAKQVPTKVKPEEIKRATKKWEQGKELTESESAALEAFAESEFSVFRPQGMRPGPNQIAVFENGKRTIWEIDPEVYRTFASGSTETNSIIWKILSVPAKLTRAGAVLSPEFAARNPVRDQFTAFVFSENKLRLFTDFTRGIGHVARRDSVYQNWLISGGPQAALVSLDRTYLQKGIREVMETRGLTKVIRNVVKNPVEMMRIISEFSEAGTRVGEFKRATKGKELTKERLLRAGLDSRNVTLDFAQMGTQARAVNMIIPFFAANLNGTDRTVRAFKDNPVRTSARVASSITIPSVMLYLHNREQEWYQDLPDWQKDLTWPIKVGDTIWRIPKPFELGIIFGTGMERVTEALLTADPDAFKGFSEAVIGGFTPGLVPSAVTPIIETFANRKIFFDTPVIPGYLEDQLPEYQYKTYTTELSKALGRTIAQFPGMKNSVTASPLILENFVQAWTGGLGRHILNAADYTLRKAGALPDPPKPASTLADVPGVRGFIIRHPSMGTQPIQEFFEKFEENETIINTISRLQKEGDIEAAERERKIAGGVVISLGGVKESISGTSRLIRMISNPKMGIPVDEQRQLIDNYYIMANQLAKQGLEMIERLEDSQ